MKLLKILLILFLFVFLSSCSDFKRGYRFIGVHWTDSNVGKMLEGIIACEVVSRYGGGKKGIGSNDLVWCRNNIVDAANEFCNAFNLSYYVRILGTNSAGNGVMYDFNCYVWEEK